MNLITCPSCNNQCSPLAPNCPKCGHPFDETEKPNESANKSVDFFSNYEEKSNSLINWKVLTVIAGVLAICLGSFAIYKLSDNVNYSKVFGFSKEQKESAVNAINSLKKIGAATEVGLNKMKYADLLIEAKTAVNQANSILPEGELKTELNLAMDGYADAGTFWDGKVIARNGENIGTKYLDLEVPESALEYSSDRKAQSKFKEFQNLCLSGIWLIAEKHLNKASKLLE